jgi:hypothetical protein
LLDALHEEMNGGDGSSEKEAGDEALAEAGWSTGTVNKFDMVEMVGW